MIRIKITIKREPLLLGQTLIRISQGIHAYLKEKDIPHVWNVTSHGHDAPEWKQALYHFVQKLIFEQPQTGASALASASEDSKPLQ